MSDFCRSSLCEVLPELSDKALTIYNCLSIDAIRHKAIDGASLDSKFTNKHCFKIVSVGRFDPVKQFEKIPDIIREIKEYRDKDFCWFIIGGQRGFASLEEEVLNKIEAYKQHNNLVLLPETNDIYNYISQSDLLVHTSKSETFSRVVNEAKALGVPVVINNYGCAHEFVRDKIDGYIVPIEEMASMIGGLIDDPSRLGEIKSSLKKMDYPNSAIVNSIMNIINK